MRWPRATICLLLLWPATALAVDRFPAPEFKSGYTLPQTVTSPVDAAWWGYIDLAVLAGALGIAAWLVHTKRSRRGVFVLTIFSLIYFGFYRQGCICPVGSIQNVAYSAGGNGYVLPWAVAVLFLLPLLFALFYGRVFCGGVCPLGAIQDVVLWKPIHLPAWLEHALGLFAYIYLGLGVMYAAVGSDFVICRYDPFVSFFRHSGAAHILFIGAVILAVSMFIGRTYCRFICPYSVLLKLLSPFSKQRVSITPKECVDCRLCEESCPFGALRYPNPRQSGRRNGNSRRQLAWALAALPVVIAAFTWIGYVTSPLLSRNDFTVRLAERIWQEEKGLVTDITNESKAFRGTGQPIEQLYQDAARIQRRFAIGGALFGTWMGLVLGLKFIGLVIRRRSDGYTADASNCVACARCYKSCPIEIEHREKRQQAKGEVVAI